MSKTKSKTKSQPGRNTRLWLNEKSAKQLNEVADAMPRVATVEPEDQGLVEARAKDKAEREEQARQQAEQRERIRRERDMAHIADKTLKDALGTYREVERCINPKEREAARLRSAKAQSIVEMRKKEIEQAQQRLIDAESEAIATKREHDRMEILSNEKLPAAKEALRAVWDVNETSWRAVPTIYRKANRDRRLKNEVKAVLGVVNAEGD